MNDIVEKNIPFEARRGDLSCGVDVIGRYDVYLHQRDFLSHRYSPSIALHQSTSAQAGYSDPCQDFRHCRSAPCSIPRPVTFGLLPQMSQSPAERDIEEDDKTEAPLTMAASVVLTNLPRDASKALETAGNLSIEKSKHHTRLLLTAALFNMLTSL